MNLIPISQLLPRVKNPKGTIKEVLAGIGGDFNVSKEILYIKVEDDSELGYRLLEVPYQAAVINASDPARVFNNAECDLKAKQFGRVIPYGTEVANSFAVMRDRYGVVQHEAAIQFLDDIVSRGKAEFHGAILTDRGARLHIIMKTPNYIELGTNDRIDCFFMVSTTHDGSGQIVVMCAPIHDGSQTVFTPVGTDSEVKQGSFKLKHSVHVTENMQKAAVSINKIDRFWQECAVDFKNFAECKMTDKDAEVFFRMVLPGKDEDSKRAGNIRDKLMDYYKLTGPTAKLPSCRGTLLGCFMAVQVWCDHGSTPRTAITGRNMVDARIEARISGDGAKKKAHAFALAKRFQSGQILASQGTNKAIV